jgi:TolB-like protein/lipoprotein NlpI
MHRLLTQLKERRIWRVLVAYPSLVFVLLQVVEFFINNYALDTRYLTAGIIGALVLFPAAVVWNWRHGEVGQQPFGRAEIGTYAVSAVAAALAAGWYWSATPADTRAAAKDLQPARSVAVMPFANTGDDPQVQYLCDGIAESLINWLATVPDVKVVTRSASFRLRDMAHDAAVVAAELGVDSVITGELELRGDKVLVSARMIDSRDDSQIWGARLAQPSDDVIFLERSIVDAIKDGLRLNLADEATATRAQGGTDNPLAYQSYLRGHYLIQSTNPETVTQGLEELRAAISLDPAFARAYADIADALYQSLLYGLSSGDDLLGEARTAAYTAIGLAPNLPEAHTALAMIHQSFDFDWDAADKAYETAIRLEPQVTGPYHRYSEYLAVTYRADRAIEMARRALAIDPLDSSSLHALGFSSLAAGNFEQAARAFGDWNRFHPASRWSYVKHAVALALAGECTASFDQAQRLEQINAGRSDSLMESWLAWSYRVCGNDEWYSRSAARIRESSRASSNPAELGMFYLHALEGNTDELLGLLVSIAEERAPLTVWIGFFESDHLGWGTSGKLSGHPRFKALLEQLQLSRFK